MFMTSVLIMNDTWGCQLALFMGIIFTVIVYSVGKGKFQPRVLVLLVAMLLTFVLAYFSNDRLRENIDTNVVQQIHDMFAFVDDDKLDAVMHIIESTCKSRKQVAHAPAPMTTGTAGMYVPSYPVHVTVGGATVFVMDVEQFHKF